jgi:hypothetical protein
MLCLLDIDAAAVGGCLARMIGYRVDHLFETNIDLTGYFDAISATAGLWCHHNEMERTMPKAVIKNKWWAFDAVDC